jgi:hypothetical protein
VSKERIRVFLVVNTFAVEIRDKALRGIDFPPVQNLGPFYADVDDHMDATIPPHSQEYAFFPSLLGEVDYFYQNDYWPSDPHFRTYSRGFLGAVAHPYIVHIYRRICHTYGYSFDDGLFSTATDLYNLVLYHHRTISQDPDTEEFSIDMAKAVPAITISSFLRAIDSMFCTKAWVDNRRKVVYLKPLQELLTAAGEDWTSKASPEFEVTPQEDNGYTLSFDWQAADTLHGNYFMSQFKSVIRALQHYNWIYERSVGNKEELNEVVLPAERDTYWVEESNAFYYFKDSEWLRLMYTDQGSVDDISSITSPVELGVYYVEADNQYFIYIKDFPLSPTPSWFHFAFPKTEDKKIGLGKTPIKSAMHPFELRLRQYFYEPYPHPCDQTGTTPAELEPAGSEADTSLRLLIYRGLDATTYPGYRYPFATPDVYDTRGVKVGTHSLRWEGEHGLYAKFWRPWLDFLGSTRKVTRTLRLNAADIFNLDMTKQVRIENINYLIGKINVAITMQGISLARAELYTVGSGTEAVMATTVGGTSGGRWALEGADLWQQEANTDNIELE